jgi:hypothetical protein
LSFRKPSSKPSESDVVTKCRHCDQEFPSKNRAYLHEREVHLAGRCYCPTCFLPFSTTYELIDHMGKEHADIEKMDCTYCNEKVTIKPDYADHFR